MNAKHTPGPWYANEFNVYKDIGDTQFPIAESKFWSEETCANARLIAAAPELLAIVQKYLNTAEDATGAFDLADIDAEARVIVAKAKGES
jgi:hypothetical protein